jgi:hypothetical protein
MELIGKCTNAALRIARDTLKPNEGIAFRKEKRTNEGFAGSALTGQRSICM